MKILVSGAGVAGLPTASWLRRFGFQLTVVERAGSLVTGGYKIDVRGTALDVLHRMGAYEAVVEASTRARGASSIVRATSPASWARPVRSCPVPGRFRLSGGLRDMAEQPDANRLLGMSRRQR